MILQQYHVNGDSACETLKYKLTNRYIVEKILHILHTQDYGMTSGNVSYYCIHHIHNLETDISIVHYRKANSCLIINAHFHTHVKSFKDCLVRAKPMTKLLNELTAKVVYSDCSHSRCT